MTDTQTHFTQASSRLAALAAEARNLSHRTRTLGRCVADAVDLPACQRAREAALQLEGLADLLDEVNR